MAVVGSAVPDYTRTVGPVFTPEGAKGTQVYTVLLDGSDLPYDAPFVALTASGLPALFYSWSASHTFLRCIERSPVPHGDSPTYWDVFCHFATGPESEDPLDEPPTVSTDAYTIRELFEADRDGNPIVNTAGDPLEVEDDIEFTVLNLGRNVASHSIITEPKYRGSVNKNPALGWPAGTLWMRSFRAGRVIRAETSYWRQEMQIVINHLLQPAGENTIPGNPPSNGYRTWARRLKNAGLRVRKTTAPYIEDILQPADGKRAGDPITAPVPLNAAGTAESSTPDAPIWLYYNLKPAVDWGPLNLSLT